jgi:hypothetical protein
MVIKRNVTVSKQFTELLRRTLKDSLCFKLERLSMLNDVNFKPEALAELG